MMNSTQYTQKGTSKGEIKIFLPTMYSTHSHLKRLYSRDSQILAFLDFQYLTMNLD
jgi:hypothetical protein